MTGAIFTIGFTRSTAAHFFARLEAAGVRTVVDVRLKPRSQLAGFAKQPDLAFLLARVSNVACLEETRLAPDPDAFAAYRAGEMGWDAYAAAYVRTLEARDVAGRLEPAAFERACLLCSEATAERCHRRLAAEHLAAAWPGAWRIAHL